MELADRIQQVEARIRQACDRAGRRREDVRIVAVTKYVGVDMVRKVLAAGMTDIGENRWQDARAKWEQYGESATWHFIGHLQSNKVKDVIGKFRYIHSLDRLSLAEEIDRKARSLDTVAECFIQLNVSGEATKYGMPPDKLSEFTDAISKLSGIRIVGLMTMAPYENDPEATRPVFRRLRELRDELNAREVLADPVMHLSMGMSNDFEIAVEEGATMLRLGSVLVGTD